jgi:hypothetical protein
MVNHISWQHFSLVIFLGVIAPFDLEKKGVLRVMVFSTTFNNISVISWRLFDLKYFIRNIGDWGRNLCFSIKNNV